MFLSEQNASLTLYKGSKQTTGATSKNKTIAVLSYQTEVVRLVSLQSKSQAQKLQLNYLYTSYK
jgi:hypothetical protein